MIGSSRGVAPALAPALASRATSQRKRYALETPRSQPYLTSNGREAIASVPPGATLQVVVVNGRPPCSATQDVESALHLGWPAVAIERASTGRSGIDAIERLHPDVVVVDTCVPDVGWLALTRDIRRRTQAVMINIACGYNDVDLIEAVEAGADDYMPVPLNRPLFVARVRAALRRANAFGDIDGAATKCGDLEVDPDRHEARVNGCDLRLSPTEFQILLQMANRFGRVTRHEMLCRVIWKEDADVYGATLRKYIQNLRRKLADVPGARTAIVTIPRVGYKLAPSESGDSDHRMAV